MKCMMVISVEKISIEMDCEITYFKAFQFPDPISENSCQLQITNRMKNMYI